MIARFYLVCLLFGFFLLDLGSSPLPASLLPATTPRPTLRPDPFATATPPTQGGHGANLFDLHCMPCHGDRGQGLTDEFRQRQYPPDDVNCWNAGCHGERPYDNGFTLPKTIPAVIGPGTLQRFTTAADLYDFVHRAMPFNAPDSLSDEQYAQLTAFLLERNGVVPAGSVLDPTAASAIFLHGVQPAATSEAAPGAITDGTASVALAGIVLLLVSLTGYVLVRLRRR